jgi:NADPH-dependent glutamate synthase beta subunit-like oxidoreductase
MLERFLADQNKGEYLPEKYFPDSGKKVAVVGSGPAGMSRAYHLTGLA